MTLFLGFLLSFAPMQVEAEENKKERSKLNSLIGFEHGELQTEPSLNRETHPSEPDVL